MFKRLWSQLFALVLVVVVGLVGCSASPGGLVGNYRQDTMTVLNSMKAVLALPDDSPDKAAAQSLARLNINDFASRYRQDPALTKLSSLGKGIDEHLGNRPHPPGHDHTFYLIGSKSTDDRSIECRPCGILTMVEKNCGDI